MQWLQDGPFFPFVDHLAPAKVTRILPENREPGKRIITLNQLIQPGNCRVIKPLRQNMPQPQPFIRKNPAHHLLERGVTRADDFMFVEPYDQFRGDKARSYITTNNVNGLIFEL